MKVRVKDQQKKVKVRQGQIKSLLMRVLKLEDLNGLRPQEVKGVRPQHLTKEAEVSVLLVDDNTIRKLNRRYRGDDCPTDVLVFSQQEGPYREINPNLLGDIVISVERALIQSKRFNQSLEKELSLYLIHGLLHLLGYDDTDPADRAKMTRRQEEILKLVTEPEAKRG